MSTQFADLVETYLRTPTAQALRDVHAEIVAGGNYDPELQVDRIAAPCVAEDRYDELRDRLMDLMPGAMLNARVHMFLADALERTGNARAARRERTLARMATRAILKSGDGSHERPWAVLHVQDETDVMAHLGHRSSHVRYESDGGRLLDLHQGDDGAEIWFDVTLLHTSVMAG